jgi:uncharacterized protein YaaQ
MRPPEPSAVDQLVLASVAGTQAGELVKRLTNDGFVVTEIDSRGGILYDATVSLLIGLESKRLRRCLEHFRECCRTRRQYIPAHAEAPILEAQTMMIEVEIGGASIYVFDVERFEQL